MPIVLDANKIIFSMEVSKMISRVTLHLQSNGVADLLEITDWHGSWTSLRFMTPTMATQGVQS